MSVGQKTLGAAEQNIGLDTDGAQFLHAVLRGLGLQFLRGVDPGHQRHVHEDAVLAAHFVAHLADGFEKRQRFDIADRAADFADHHVHFAGQLLDGGLDFVGDVRNHLHGLAEIIAAPLALDDLFVDAAAGQVVGAGERGVGEALVVAEIEIGFGAVVGDENLAVLERAHGAGIDVEVGIEFLQRDGQAAAFEQAADGRRRDAFAERRNHAAGDENEFSHSPDVSGIPDSGLVERPHWPARINSWTRSRSAGVSTPSDS